MEERGRGNDADSRERGQIWCKTWGTCLMTLTLSKVVGQERMSGLEFCPSPFLLSFHKDPHLLTLCQALC